MRDDRRAAGDDPAAPGDDPGEAGRGAGGPPVDDLPLGDRQDPHRAAADADARPGGHRDPRRPRTLRRRPERRVPGPWHAITVRSTRRDTIRSYSTDVATGVVTVRTIQVRRAGNSLAVTLPSGVDMAGFTLGAVVTIEIVTHGELRLRLANSNLTSAQASVSSPVESTPLSLIPSSQPLEAPEGTALLAERAPPQPSTGRHHSRLAGSPAHSSSLKKGSRAAEPSVIEKARARATRPPGNQLLMPIGSAPPASATVLTREESAWHRLVAALGATINASGNEEFKRCVGVATRLRASRYNPPVTAEEIPQLRDAWGVVFPGLSWHLEALPKHVGALRIGAAPTPRGGEKDPGAAVRRMFAKHGMPVDREEDRW